MDENCLIELRDVRFAYARSVEPVLQGVNLRINRGEFVSIIGGTGSGKSTLLSILSGLIPHYVMGELTGDVYIFGEETRSLSLSKITTNVGMVLQDPDMQLFNMYVKQELLWGLENRGISLAEMERRLHELLPIFELQNLQAQFCSGISGGQKQKVAIAAVYLTQPKIMLLDNPTSMLDPVSTKMVLDTIRKLSEMHQTIVMVEENIFELLSRADRLVLLDKGKIVLDASPREYQRMIPKLREAGLYVPQIWELCYLLDVKCSTLKTFPLSLDEAEETFKEWLKG